MKKLGPIGFLTGASLVALAQPAAAQEEDEAPAGAEMAAAGETPLAPGEIIVTAQRREQSQQDVPLSISVVSSEALDQSNLTTIADVQFLAPGVNYNANFGGGFNIRGVGTQSLLMSAEQSVALVIDDVIQGLPEVSFAGPSYQSLVDIERIEVLKGPQGTLFGKNSSAGVIQIITANPRLGERTLEGSLSYATKDEINVETVVNLPLGETAALRVAGGLQRRDGFVQDLFSGKDRWAYQRYSLRGKLLWEPATDLSVLLTGEYRYLTDNANGLWTFRNCGSGFGAFSPCETIAPYGIQAGPRNLEVATDGESFTRQKSYTFSGRVDYDLGNATLRVPLGDVGGGLGLRVGFRRVPSARLLNPVLPEHGRPFVVAADESAVARRSTERSAATRHSGSDNALAAVRQICTQSEDCSKPAVLDTTVMLVT